MKSVDGMMTQTPSGGDETMTHFPSGGDEMRESKLFFIGFQLGYEFIHFQIELPNAIETKEASYTFLRHLEKKVTQVDKPVHL